MKNNEADPQGINAYRDMFRVLTELLPQTSGLLWSQGLEPYLGAGMAPSVSRPLAKELVAGIETKRTELLAERHRVDPLVDLFREWAGAELAKDSKLEEHRTIGHYRRRLGFSVKEITALVWSKHTVSELVTLACLGDDKSLLRLVELDKLFLTAQFTRDRIRQGVGREDQKFFGELARAVEKDAYRENIEASRLGIACYLLWFLGFDKLGKRKLLSFIESEGLAEYADPKSFDRFLSRIGLKVHPTVGDMDEG